MAVVVNVYGKADFKQIERAEKQLASLKKEAASGGSVWKKYGSEIAGAGKSMTLFASVPIVIGMGAAVMAASDLEEEMNKVKVVFGQSASAVIDFGETGAKSLGMAQTEALAAAGAFGNLFKTTGLTDKAAADMSMNFVKLANDMASFNNIPVADALEKLRSGLVGEAEPLRTVGVLLSEARVQEEAYASGIATRGAKLTEAQKVQARYNLILKDTQVQQGDFERTSGSLANQLRTLRASVIDMAAQFGTVLIPMIKPVVGILTGIASGLASMPAPLRYVTVGILGIVAATGPVLWGLGSMAKGLDAVRSGASIARSVLTTVPGVLGRLADGYRSTQAAQSAFSGVAGTLGGKLKDLTTMIAGLPAKINLSIAAMGAWVIAIAAVAAAVYLTINAYQEWQAAEKNLAQAKADGLANETSTLDRIKAKYGENSKQYQGMVAAIARSNAAMAKDQESQLTGLAGWVDSWAMGMKGGLVGIFAKGTATIVALMQELFVKRLPKLLGGFVGGVKTTFADVAGWISGGFTRGAAAVIQTMRALPGRIVTALGNPKTLLANAGDAIIKGLWDGINRATAGLLSRVSGLGKRIAKTILDSLGIHSPSTVMIAAGKNVAAGLAQGIAAGRQQAIAAAADLAGGVRAAMTPLGIAVAGPAMSAAGTAAAFDSGSGGRFSSGGTVVAAPTVVENRFVAELKWSTMTGAPTAAERRHVLAWMKPELERLWALDKRADL